ncbi:MAG: hypothetical protein J6P78_02155 [Lachnospiraceae bacterium]|nr:hypothetical protein [Lachnospiraceae bacterium]
MTPPSFDEDEAVPMNGIMGILSGLFSSATRDDGAEEGGAGEGAEAGASTFRKIFNSVEFLIKPLGFTVVTVILILLLIPFVKEVITLIRIGSMKKKGNYSDALLVRYRSYVKKLYDKKLVASVNTDSVDLAAELAGVLKKLAEAGEVKSAFERMGDPEDKILSIGRTVRTAAFSNESISDPDYRETCKAMKDVLKSLSGIRSKKVKSLQKSVETV